MESNARAEANLKQAVPFFNVTNLEAATRFYVDGLGFKMTNEWIHESKRRWCWLEREGVALMLQEFWKEGPHANVPTGKLGVGVSICFICADAFALYREFCARGVPASKPFVGNGMWVTSVHDPDGYRLEFESYTDTPEGTEFAETEQ